MTNAVDTTGDRLLVAGGELARASRQLYDRGWMPGTSGNLSLALPGSARHMVITASGRSKGELTATDAVLVDIATARAVRAGSLRPSAETAIHAALYTATGCAAVIHVHSPHATAVASIAPPPDTVRAYRFDHYELIKGLGVADPTSVALPVFPNWPDVSRIAEDVTRYFAALGPATSAPPALLLAHHGATVWGADHAQARDRLECVEALCQLVLLDPTHRREGRNDHGPVADHA